MNSLIQKNILKLASSLPMPGRLRGRLYKIGGVKIADTKRISIGDGAILDTLNPSGIILDKWVTVTMKCVILSHYYDTSKRGRVWKFGIVHIKEGAFLGAGAVVCSPVVIGKWSIVGAGSVVTKNIPDYEIWAGNPARFIKVRPGYEEEHRRAVAEKSKENNEKKGSHIR